MRLTASIREQVRQHAQCACEFCGVTEIDVGGMLTIDHFQPRTKAGSDTLENLIYACIACNQYKQDYWPRTEIAPILWNPRQESASQHFVEQEDGQLTALLLHLENSTSLNFCYQSNFPVHPLPEDLWDSQLRFSRRATGLLDCASPIAAN